MVNENLIFKKTPLGKLHFFGWVLITIINTLIVLNEDKKSRMMLLLVVVVLQFATLLLFMIDYESLGREQWRKKEAAIRKEYSSSD